jgi:hypothetical protein
VIKKMKPWCAVPFDPIVGLLPQLKWQPANGAPASANAAALILYATLIFVSDSRSNDETVTIWYRATASYSELETLTGLSRALIAAGLKRLIELKLMAASGSNQKRVYLIFGKGKRWFKLPCRALFDGERITPFHRLTLRSKLDLHALKLYFYLASVRDNQHMFSMASHPTIHANMEIPQSDIRRAHSLLTSVGLLAAIERDFKGLLKVNEPNKYYLHGYQAFVMSRAKAD